MKKIICFYFLLCCSCFAQQDPDCIATPDCKCRCVSYYKAKCGCKVPCKPKILEISAKIDKQNNKIDFILP